MEKEPHLYLFTYECLCTCTWIPMHAAAHAVIQLTHLRLHGVSERHTSQAKTDIDQGC